ncbi:hypothetical protein GALMADRAFT_254722 [Galerina marginata CBS 339.88]|uniref:Uncharacterized protein n=1 Tax=Galerina marginata (strain CBS 339.88) TaxID=685588 RepID=A0A067SI98_GALM3|nr:hypothetical protein GALMADRAFT_254722 [Galerina marginata CBS 339.88]
MLSERQSSSPSPSRRLSLGSKISALGAKISRTLNPSEREHAGNGEESDSVAPILSQPHTDRSQSRGREAFSTGRGGIGNIRQTSLSRDARPTSGPDDFSVTRGREPIANPNQVFSTGRGGAGNLRSPSRDPKPRAEVEAAEQEVIRDYVAAHEGAAFSSGRGGLGNINRSRSRDPAASITSTPKFSTGRGGAGNIVSGDGQVAESIDDEERRRVGHVTQGLHSTGRGGAANITSAHEPAVEHHPHLAPEFESTGRGGAGNIVRDRSASRQRS